MLLNDIQGLNIGTDILKPFHAAQKPGFSAARAHQASEDALKISLFFSLPHSFRYRCTYIIFFDTVLVSFKGAQPYT